MITIAQTVAASSATADIAYYVCVVSFFIAGGVAIYLLWDKTKQHKATLAKSRVVRPTAKKRAPAKKAAPKKKTVAKKAPAKKPAKRTAKKK